MSARRRWFFTDSPYAGGAESYLRDLVRAAPREGYGLAAVERAGLRPWLDEVEGSGVVVRRLAPGPVAVEWARAARWLGRERPELLHINLPGPYGGLMGALPRIARLAGTRRVVVTEHLPTVGRVGRRWWAKRAAVGAVDAAICVCEAHAAAMHRLGYPTHRIHPVVNGIADPNPGGRIAALAPAPWPADLARLVRATGHPAVDVVQVGALDPRKGADDLLRATRLLRDRGVWLRTWLVGEGSERAALLRLRDELGLADQVVLAGSRPDVPAILAAADIAVLASHREGLPLSLLEAAAHGLPLVSTRVDGIPEVVEHRRNGLLVEAGDALGLARALSELARDPATRARMGIASRRRYLARFRRERMLGETFALHDGPVAAGSA